MARIPGGFWGPRPRWALIPLAAVGVTLGWVALRQAADVAGPLPVTVLKPIPADDGRDEALESVPPVGEPVAMPIEVRYGVPSPRTARLWPEPLPR